VSRGGIALLLGLGWAAAAAAADYAPGAPLETLSGPRVDFALRCRGCHGFAGEGTPGHVPRLDGFVGLFTQVPGGRDYLMRVPGVARSALDDTQLADVLNWMLATYGAGQVEPSFAPYSAAEVSSARRRVLLDRRSIREELLAAMRARGLLDPGEDGFGRSAEHRG
jgi:hypothetical protein